MSVCRTKFSIGSISWGKLLFFLPRQTQQTKRRLLTNNSSIYDIALNCNLQPDEGNLNKYKPFSSDTTV